MAESSPSRANLAFTSIVSFGIRRISASWSTQNAEISSFVMPYVQKPGDNRGTRPIVKSFSGGGGFRRLRRDGHRLGGEKLRPRELGGAGALPDQLLRAATPRAPAPSGPH